MWVFWLSLHKEFCNLCHLLVLGSLIYVSNWKFVGVSFIFVYFTLRFRSCSAMQFTSFGPRGAITLQQTEILCLLATVSLCHSYSYFLHCSTLYIADAFSFLGIAVSMQFDRSLLSVADVLFDQVAADFLMRLCSNCIFHLSPTDFSISGFYLLWKFELATVPVVYLVYLGILQVLLLLHVFIVINSVA